MRKHEGGSSRKANSGHFQLYEYQHVGLIELYPVICSSWRSDTALRTYIADLCFLSTLFRKIMTTQWEPKSLPPAML